MNRRRGGIVAQLAQTVDILDGNDAVIHQHADAKGKAYQADKKAQAAAAVKEMMRNAEAKAAVNAEEIMHHAENQCAVLRARAETRLDAAADSIVERIVID